MQFLIFISSDNRVFNPCLKKLLASASRDQSRPTPNRPSRRPALPDFIAGGTPRQALPWGSGSGFTKCRRATPGFLQAKVAQRAALHSDRPPSPSHPHQRFLICGGVGLSPSTTPPQIVMVMGWLPVSPLQQNIQVGRTPSFDSPPV